MRAEGGYRMNNSNPNAIRGHSWAPPFRPFGPPSPSRGEGKACWGPGVFVCYKTPSQTLRSKSMSSDLMTRPKDRFVTVAGLKLRYIEEGEGPAVIFLHGASLGSSADVFIRNLHPLARAGFRAIAYDQPGFGLSDVP